jgi:hypothetical protein
MYRKAQSRGWTHTAEILLQRLVSDIAAVNSASRALRPPRLADLPAVPDILAEITHLQDEFDEVDILPKEGRIDVTTDAITLEDVCLGPFCIQLHFERLAKRRDVSAFMIVAQEANPASSDSQYTHPHVSGESLCAGDAVVPISSALAEGRIGDAFQLVNRVLHTYNPGSAYVSLDSWDGIDCPDCGNTTSGDSLYNCDHCDQSYCDNCIRTCDQCETPVCGGCSTTADDGSRLCPKCKELADQEPDEFNDDEEDNTIVPDDPDDDSTEEQPQPPTEIHHEQSHAPDHTDSRRAELPGGTADAADPHPPSGNTADVSSPRPQAA